MSSIINKYTVYLALFAAIISIPLSSSFEIQYININLPIEALLIPTAGVLILGFSKKEIFNSPFLRHPLSLIGILHQGVVLLSVFYSSDPFVSLKYALVSICHFWVFYFGTYFILINHYDLNKIFKYFGLLVGCIILYALVRLSFNQFSKDIIPDIPRPFFSDHTLLGATIGFALPLFLVYLKSYYKKEKIIWIVLVLFTIGLAILRSRAVWLSLFTGTFFYFIIRFKSINPKLVSIIFIASLFTAFFFITTISTENYYSNKSETELKTPFNIKDVSTLERFNRYSCAYRMWLTRPVLGFGIGTFQFEYFPFQLSTQMTRISVVSERQVDGKPHSSGKGGGAHSEYMQALSELGLLGLIVWMTLIFMSVYYGLRLYYRDDKPKSVYLSIVVSLVGFYTHALFNNFLHNEEISFLFWSCLAIIAYNYSISKSVVQSE